MKEELLKEAIERLAVTKQEIIEKINSYEQEIEKYKESNKELEDSFSIEVYNGKTEKYTKSLQASKGVKEKLERLKSRISDQKELVKNILEYNTTFGNLDEFFNMVLKVDGYDVQMLYEFCNTISKTTTVKLPFKASDLTTFNQKRIALMMKVDMMIQEKVTFGRTLADRSLVAKEVKEMIKKNNFIPFYDTLIKYFSDNLKEVDSIAKSNGIAIQEIREKEIEKRKEEVNNNIKEINRKIDECKKSLVSIGDIYRLYDEYKKTESKDILIKLTEELTNLVIISQRESKMLKHEEKEKTTDEEIVTEEIKIPIISNEEKILDSDYFRRSDTVRIICFLGNKNDSIINDIENYFDKSIRHKVLERMDSIFNTLFQDRKHIARAGGDPDGTTSKKTLKLLDSPYDFTYRRYAEGGDKFRIHAIRRYSKILQDFGYGEGNIVFFGAVGPNKSINEKRSTYNRLGRRAVEEIGPKGSDTKLTPSFDYIEHITRGYIPISLLSENDIEKLKNYEFNKILPGSVEQTIENNKYVLFDSLDSTSKTNVKKWLDDYFVEQTNILFEIKDMYKKLKGTPLD